MQILVTGKQMKQLDQSTIKQMGIPSLVLMEREALAVFGTEAFAGQGKRTLKWLVEEGVPYIDIFSGIECC